MINFLVRTRYPAYTQRLDEVVRREARDSGSNEGPLSDESLDKISVKLSLDFTDLQLEVGTDGSTTVPDESAPDDEKLTWRRQYLLRYLNAVRDYQDELWEVPPAALRARYNEERAKALTQRKAQGAERDELAFFNGVEAKADFAHWISVASWTDEQAVALSLGKEPRIVNSETLSPLHRVAISPFREEYARRCEKVKGAVTAGQLGEDIDRVEFLVWARGVGIEYPSELDVVRTQEIPQSKPDKKKRKSPTLLQGDEKVADATQLRAIVTDLRQQLSSCKAARTNEKNKLLELLFVTIYTAYGYNPLQPDPKTVGEIRKDAENFSIKLDHDTILKRLREAREQLSPETEERLQELLER
jgi:hypothetical protein